MSQEQEYLVKKEAASEMIDAHITARTEELVQRWGWDEFTARNMAARDTYSAIVHCLIGYGTITPDELTWILR